jgi:hypothetical protein
MSRAFGALVVASLLVLPAPEAAAQALPSSPVTAFDGRLVVGAEVAAAIGNSDEDAYFNYTDYEHNALRLFRAALSAAWRPTDKIAFIGEIRTEDLDIVRAHAAYARIRPWSHINFDIQIGQIPPSFGTFGRRGYQITDNALIGYPLAYQYLTALRADAAPVTTTDLLVMRARGWRVSYPLGSTVAGPGVPIITAFRWDTGVQGHWEGKTVDITAGVTNGTLSDPHVRDNNDGKQISGRAGFKPIPGLVIGTSGSHGKFLSNTVMQLTNGASGSGAQTAFGADAEYSRDHWLVRAEMIWSRWNMPLRSTGSSIDLHAIGFWTEGRYRLAPRIVLAGRADHLGFSELIFDTGPRRTWDAPVTRYEGDIGYYLQRNLIARFAAQYNYRNGGRDRIRSYYSGQIAYWF